MLLLKHREILRLKFGCRGPRAVIVRVNGHQNRHVSALAMAMAMPAVAGAAAPSGREIGGGTDSSQML